MYQLARLGISALPVIIGIILLAGAMENIALSDQASAWPTTEGRITATRVSGSYSVISRQSYIEYQYWVGGTSYTGNLVGFGGGGVSDFKGKDNVTVHYNPDNHEESVLVTGFRMTYLFNALVAACLIATGQVLWKRLK